MKIRVNRWMNEIQCHFFTAMNHAQTDGMASIAINSANVNTVNAVVTMAIAAVSQAIKVYFRFLKRFPTQRKKNEPNTNFKLKLLLFQAPFVMTNVRKVHLDSIAWKYVHVIHRSMYVTLLKDVCVERVIVARIV